jgi:putative heme-binding domain-containing protein
VFRLGLIAFGAAAALWADTPLKIKLPVSRAEIAAGQRLFALNCARCHGAKGEGSRGPTLTRPKLPHAPDDAALVGVIKDGIRGTEMPGVGAMDDHEILQTAAYVRSLGKIPLQPVPGDPARGAELFRGKGNCGACHSIHGEGGVAGPDLTTVGDARAPSHLRNAVLDPQSVIPDDYLLVTVVPANGSSVTGQRVNEDSFSIQVRDAGGSSHSFWKSDLRSIEKQRGKTPMPSYKGRLSDPELTDLVAFLASLKEKK